VSDGWRFTATCPKCDGHLTPRAIGKPYVFETRAIAECEKCSITFGLAVRLTTISHRPYPVRKPAQTVECGTASQYRYGCRCDACRAANTAAKKAYRHGTVRA
jgi:hypothetical protein